MAIINLTKEEVQFCIKTGQQRYLSNRKANNPKGTNADIYPGQSDECGMLAEFAMLKGLGHTDLYNYDFFINQGEFGKLKHNIKDINFNGVLCEVRSSLHPNGHLAIKQRDFINNTNVPFVFAVVDSRYIEDETGKKRTEIRYLPNGGINVTFHGWLTAQEVKDIKNWQRGYEQWWAKKNQLKPMYELPGLENN